MMTKIDTSFAAGTSCSPSSKPCDTVVFLYVKPLTGRAGYRRDFLSFVSRDDDFVFVG